MARVGGYRGPPKRLRRLHDNAQFGVGDAAIAIVPIRWLFAAGRTGGQEEAEGRGGQSRLFRENEPSLNEIGFIRLPPGAWPGLAIRGAS